MPVKMLREFFLLESAGGILLVIAAAVAIFISNSPLEHYYHDTLNAPVIIQIGSFSIDNKFTQIGIAVFGYVIQLSGLFHS